MWQGGLRVPAFITGPNIPIGAKYTNMMHITDVQMTLLEMIKQAHNGTKPLDGVSHWNHIHKVRVSTENLDLFCFIQYSCPGHDALIDTIC